MKRIIVVTVLLILSVSAYIEYTSEATCSGTKNCNACKNCKYCKHCAKEGGTCGVCN